VIIDQFIGTGANCCGIELRSATQFLRRIAGKNFVDTNNDILCFSEVHSST